MDVVLDPQEQPDFQAMSGYLHGLSTEVGRCSNLVAVQNTNAVLDAIARLTTVVENLGTELRTEIRTTAENLGTELTTEIRTTAENLGTELRTEIRTTAEHLRTEMQVMGRSLQFSLDDLDYNSRARVLNSAAYIGELALHPLKNITTHEVVPLPATMRDLLALRVDEVERYLQALGQTPIGNADEKKAQLKNYIGIHSV